MPRKSPSAKKASVPLERYRQKRNFKNTPEPGAEVAAKTGQSFVIQEHHARSHHFDFRLEMDGVLVSWAVPKGIPEDTAAKRLAVHVEDHPLEYGKFEGEIPEGNYGAGTVAIWDKGIWSPASKNWKREFEKGKLKFALHGNRLNGAYVLARMKEEPNWLLRKIDDDSIPDLEIKPQKEEAHFVSPQLARPVPTVPEGSQWIHELKYDGYRLIAVRKKGKVRLYTRSQLDWTGKFSSLAARLCKLPGGDFVFDGEAVVFDGKGRSRFGDLQAALQDGTGDDIVFVAFDILHSGGLNLRDLPLDRRLQELAKLVPEEKGLIRRSKVWSADQGKDLFKQACQNGLEGIISKNSRGRYIEGSRRDWAKSKCRARQEFVICGYTQPKGSLPAFGALVLGSYEKGKLVPRGKVGTGFSDKLRRGLLSKFKKLELKKAHFESSGDDVTWLKPKLVAEIDFAEITRDGSIRQGSFVALRDDKAAGQVHMDGLQRSAPEEKDVKVAGITITHPGRLVYPEDQITKMEVAKHYERVGKWMLPHIAKRPLAVVRAPGGLGGELFFQKSFTSHVPAKVVQKDIDADTTVFYVNDVAGIVSLVQFGVIEFHPWGSSMPQPEKPDMITWDLDPDDAVPWKEVLGAAYLLRDTLAEHGLKTVVKLSGGKGIHIILHIRRTHDWETVRSFAKNVAAAIAELNPRKFLIKASKAKRAGKIYIDWMRNGKGATCIAPWCLRARAGAAVSMPVNWADLRHFEAAGFTIREPLAPPSEWKTIKSQTLPKKVVAFFAESR